MPSDMAVSLTLCSAARGPDWTVSLFPKAMASLRDSALGLGSGGFDSVLS